MAIIPILLTFFLSPLFLGVINRIKSLFAGRKGPPLLQLYYDLWKLFRKNDIISKTTTGIFRLSPLVSLASVAVISLFIPFSGKALFSFTGDLIFIAYLFGLMRMFTVLGALDTGSSFEGMGASREVAFAAFAEPSLFLIFAALVKKTGQLSLSCIYSCLGGCPFVTSGSFLLIVSLVLFLLLLVENCRMPIDDPNTHLELTMIHEVMVLDYSSRDLAAIFYSASIKLWIYASLLVRVLFPSQNMGAYLLAMFGTAIAIGVIESTIARVRLLSVFTLLVLALALASFSFLLLFR